MTALRMQFAPHFLAPVTEDPMELTSDTDQRTRGANDIDIDFDLTVVNQHDVEDEFMGEEDINALAASTSADGPNIYPSNDDVMADDSYTQGLVDEGSSVRDEDIGDAEYAGPELEEDTIVVPNTEYLNEQSEELVASYGEAIRDQNQEQDYQEQDYDEQDYDEQEHHPQEHHEQPTKPEVTSGVVEKAVPSGRTELVITSDDVAKAATERMSEGQRLVISKEAVVNPGAADQTSEPLDVEVLTASEAKPEQVREEALPALLDQDVVARSKVEGSRTRGEDAIDSPARLHPILLDYQGDEMFLFPPVDQSGEHAATFLLADEQHAYGNIGKLLEACRYVLKGSLSEQDELMITIHDLDLHISESTIDCTNTRLSEVVDLYLRLQQNDGLENPPPLYMDLTAKNRFSCRLNVLRNALIEGTGLSLLKISQETENGQQHGLEGEADPSNYTTVQSNDGPYVSEQQPGEEAEGSIEQYSSLRHAPSSESLTLENDSGTQGTQSYAVKDVAHEKNYRAEALLGGDSSVHLAGAGDNYSTEAVGSMESFEHAQPLAGNSELQKAEEPIVDDGDYIDYEDVEELKDGSSSASSTLQGDTINIHTVKDHVPNEPTVAQHQEHEPTHGGQGSTVADENTLQEYVEKKDTSDIVVSVEEEQPDAAAISSQCLDDNGQSLSWQFDEGREASENNQEANISQGTESQSNVIADDRHETSAQYEDDAGSYWQDTLHEHADQTQGNACLLAETDNNADVEGYSSTYPLDSESSGSGRIIHDDDLGRVNRLEAKNELEEADGSLANDDNDDVPQLFEEMNTRPSLFFGQSAQTQEDDDEITYEDEESDIDSSHGPAQANHNVATIPESLKRTRNFHEDDDTLKEDLQDSKRVRSG